MGIDKTSVVNAVSVPSGYSAVGNYVYDLEALADVTTQISSFDQAITVSIAYTTSDISGITGSTLKIYRWNGSSWSELSTCSVDTGAKTVTCSTTAFSTFMLVGQASSNSSSTSSSSSAAAAPSCGNITPTSAPWVYGAISQGSTSIMLYFTDAGDPVDKYVLQFGTKSGNYPFGATNVGGKGMRTYLVEHLLPNTTYYFRVRGGNGCATGSWSNELSAKTYAFTPTVRLIADNFELKSISCSSRYVVKKGDTLWAIAQQLLGNGSKYKEILRVNKELDNDGARLTVGGELQIPCPSDSLASDEAQPKDERQLTVKVTDKNKKPVVGAKVTLHSKPREATTDKNGQAVFTDVEPGNHRLVIAYKDYTGEQSLNLSGEVKEFDLTITVQTKNPFLTFPILLTVGVLVLIILLLILKLIKIKHQNRS